MKFNLARLFLSALITAITIPQMGMCECPLTVSALENSVDELITAPGGISAKIEKDWIKMRTAGAFETSEWSHKSFENGVAAISSYYSSENGKRLVAELYAVKNDDQTVWYFVSRLNPTSNTNNWIVATNAGGEFSCSIVAQTQKLQLTAADLRVASLNKEKFEIADPSVIYQRLGW